MRFEIIKKRKKSGGIYYLLVAYDEYGLPRVFGRYKTRAKVERALEKYRRKYGG